MYVLVLFSKIAIFQGMKILEIIKVRCVDVNSFLAISSSTRTLPKVGLLPPVLYTSTRQTYNWFRIAQLCVKRPGQSQNESQ